MSLLSRSFPSVKSVLRSAWKPIRAYSTKQQFAASPKPPTGIKKLIKQYGYSALGVYLGISIIDIPLCWLVVHSAGEEKIRDVQNSVKEYLGYEINKNDNEESTEKSSTFWTEFAVAYALHKSLVFIRLPIAAALTPTIVRLLRSWGFKVGGNIQTVAAQQIKGKFDPTATKIGKSASKSQKIMF